MALGFSRQSNSTYRKRGSPIENCEIARQLAVFGQRRA